MARPRRPSRPVPLALTEAVWSPAAIRSAALTRRPNRTRSRRYVAPAVSDTPIVAAASAATTERSTWFIHSVANGRDRDEEDPECDRSRKRQDPKHAHHHVRLPAGPRLTGPKEVPVGTTRWYGRCRRPLSRGARLVYSARPHPQRARSRHGPCTRRSAIALPGRIGRPVRRPSDRSTAIRRSIGGDTGDVYPAPRPIGRGLCVWQSPCSSGSALPGSASRSRTSGALAPLLTRRLDPNGLATAEAIPSTGQAADSQFAPGFGRAAASGAF